MDFIPPVQLPTGLAEESVRLTEQGAAVPSPGAAFAEGMAGMLSEGLTKKAQINAHEASESRLLAQKEGMESRLQGQRAAQELRRSQTESQVPVDDMFLYTAKQLGYPEEVLPKKGETVSVDGYRSMLAQHSQQMKLDAAKKKWDEHMKNVGASKDATALNATRKNLMNDWTMDPQDKLQMIQQIDAKLAEVEKTQAKPKPKNKASKEVLPGFSVE